PPGQGYTLTTCPVFRDHLRAQNFLWLSVASGVVNLWSYGIMTNYREDEKTPSVPTMLNFMTFIAGAVLLIMAFFREDLDRLIAP
ncbi:MAG: hypothetical protein OXQ31_04145, partial [Spirochaetaceae bacterium]|nr:hypothetical protein [Spirochaetaceae bacterium]